MKPAFSVYHFLLLPYPDSPYHPDNTLSVIRMIFAVVHRIGA